MSLETWKEEFYRKPAGDTSTEEALHHSLKKWQGLRTENLNRHGITVTAGASLIDDSPGTLRFGIDSESCALCFHYMYTTPRSCEACQLFKVRGSRCDNNSTSQSPFSLWQLKHDPEPMIALIEKAIEKYGKKQKPEISSRKIKAKAKSKRKKVWIVVRRVGDRIHLIDYPWTIRRLARSRARYLNLSHPGHIVVSIVA